jgi:cytochrome c oxidase subunit 4
MSTETIEAHDAHAEGGHAHPTDIQYVYVALFLGVLTAAEVSLYYVNPAFLVSALILGVLAVVKFATVAMWFMHLRFDSKIFRSFFTTGLVLALIVYPIMLTTFHFWSGG